MARKRRTQNERFDEKIDKTNSCWLWTGDTNRKGYGRFFVEVRKGRNVRVSAHRFAYERWVGPIPEDFDIDHLCRNHSCVRPDHLQAVPRRVNLLRGATFAATNAAKDRCPRGHIYTGTSMAGSRVCGHCRAVRGREAYHRKMKDPEARQAYNARAREAYHVRKSRSHGKTSLV